MRRVERYLMLHVIDQKWKDHLLNLDALRSGIGLRGMGQVDPKEAGETAYMLANGQGKGRAGRTGNSRPRRYWRVLFLSTGEISLGDHLRSIGRDVKAGQEVRLADIPMDTGVYGGFEQLHDFESGSEFSDSLCRYASQYHGTALRAYLSAIVDKRSAITALTKSIQSDFRAEHVPPGSVGQVARVAEGREYYELSHAKAP